MTKRQESQLISHLNRMVVAALSVGGMVLDGFQGADAVLALALALWLWMPECRRFEIQLLGRARKARIGDCRG